ncbi:MAG: AAA family ATPase, partial [Candidatus Micrarchaeota archaeon]|nr:AAA family ATPase [Candidatus Micrarchaeota archaeon]
MKNDSRVSTGITGLDKILGGGIPEGDLILVSGIPGTGKTVLGLKFICDGAENGEKGLYVSFDSDTEFIRSQARGLGLGFDECIEKNRAALLGADEKDIYRALDDIETKVKEMGAKRLVIDSISVLAVYATSYRNLPEDLIAFLKETDHVPPIMMGEVVQKQMIYTIISRLRRLGCTTVITSELPKNSEWFSRDTVSEFAADGIILLDQHALGEENVRTLQVVKMKRSKYREG